MYNTLLEFGAILPTHPVYQESFIKMEKSVTKWEYKEDLEYMVKKLKETYDHTIDKVFVHRRSKVTYRQMKLKK